MITVNWCKFQAKVGDSAPVEFERLCYFIFCRKYNRPYGIFRYRNHPALETSPIEVDGELIGFQAKYFVDKFSSHKSDILEAIQKVAKRYGNLKRLVFFMPMDHDCNQNAADKNIETAAQREVEGRASSLGFTIEWFCHSHFEATFSNKEYFDIGCHYFSDDKGLFALFDEIDICKNRFLRTIHDSIEVGGKRFKIVHRKILEHFDGLEPGTIFVLHGEGGIGKSGTIKDLIKTNNDSVWVFRPEEVVKFFRDDELSRNRHTTLANVIDETNDLSNRVLVVDSAEKIENLESDTSIFFAVISSFIEAGWKIVFTVRTMFCDMLIQYLSINISSARVQQEMIHPLTLSEIGEMETVFNVALPNEVCAFHFLKIPFYLNIYLKNAKEFQKVGLRDFKKHLWLLMVQGGHTGDPAADCFQRLVVNQIENHNYWLDVSSAKSDDISALIKREILLQDVSTSQYYIAHDVYEEIALEHEIEKIFVKYREDEFFLKIPESRPMIRAFRMWLNDKLVSDVDSVKGIVHGALNHSRRCWRNETLIAILNSPYAKTFLAENKVALFVEGATFLFSVIKLIRCTCKEQRRDFPIAELANTSLRYYLTRPSGCAWKVLVEFICDNDDCLHGFDLGPIVDFMCEWTQSNPTGDVARKAGLFAMKVALQDGKEFETHYNSWGNLAKIITASSKEIHNELQEFILFTLTDYDPSTGGIQRDIYKGVLEHPIEHINFIKEFPELTRQMAKVAWFANRKHYYSTEWVEEVFGLSGQFFNSCVCPSAYATPIYILLKIDFAKTLDFVIDIVNKSIYHAAGWKQDDIGIKRTKISFPSGEVVEQYISGPLWCMHRGVGSPVTPYLLQSIHMALERVMLEAHKEWANDANVIEGLERLAIDTLRKSKSASITGSLTSLVLAYPDKYFELASIILTSREMIKADHVRGLLLEAECKSLYDLYGNRNDECVAERRSTLEDKFRNETLESIMFRYQMELDDPMHVRKQRMHSLLDGYSELSDDDDRFFILRADSRKRHVEKHIDPSGNELLLLVPNIPEDLTKVRQEAQDKVLPNHICQCLITWGIARIKGEKVPDYLMCYDNDAFKTISDFKYVFDLAEKGDPRIFIVSSLAYPAAALLLFYPNVIDTQVRSTCEKMLLTFGGQILSPGYMNVLLDGVDAALIALPLLVKSNDKGVADKARKLMLLSMIAEDRIGMSTNRICDMTFMSVRSEKFARENFADQYVPKYLYLRDQFQKYISDPQNRPRISQRRSQLASFLSYNEDIVAKALLVTSFDVDALSANPNRVYALGNSILLLAPTKENVEKNKALIVKSIHPVLSEIYAKDDDYPHGCKYLEPFAAQYQRHLARILLLMNKDVLQASISELLKVPHLVDDNYFLSLIIAEENALSKHDNFWSIWTALIPAVALMLNDDSFSGEFDNNSVIEYFFLGKILWRPGVTSWKAFRDKDIAFYDTAIRMLPPSLGCLSALASFCNGIGAKYWKDILKLMVGVISSFKEDERWHDAAIKRAVGKLEEFVLRVVLNNADQIKKNDGLWNDVIMVLDWLVEQQSTLSYQLREQLI